MGANLQAVELDEDGAPERADPAPAPPPRHRRRWPWVLGALVAVAALAGGQQVVDARHRAYEARFEKVPGVLRPLTRDPQPLWTVPSGRWGVVQARGSFVAYESRADDARVEGLDPLTGKARWQMTVPAPGATDDAASGGTDGTAGAATEAGVDCRPLDGGRGSTDRIACLVSPTPTGVGTDDGSPTAVVVLDARTGRTVGRWQEPVQAWAAAGGRVLVASGVEHDGSRTWTVTAHEPGGAVAWTRTLTWTVPAPTADGVSSGWALDADADHVLLSADGHAAVLDAAGRVTRRLDGDALTGWSLGRAGLVVEQVLRPDDLDGSPEGSYTTSTEIDVPGLPPEQSLLLTVDDGSVPGLALTTASSGGVAVYDLRDGAEQLWRDDAVSAPRILLGGILYTESGSEVVAFDARTGRRVWERPVPAGETIEFTDGHLLYVLVDGGVLETFALSDGTPGRSWQTAQLTPAGSDSPWIGMVQTWNGLLTVVSSEQGDLTVVG